MSTWIKIESQKGHLEESWENRKASLENKIKLLNLEKSSIQELVDSSSLEGSEADQERQSLLEMQNSLEQEQQRIEQATSQTIAELNQIVSKLPPPVASQWRKHLTDLTSKDLSTSERLESTLNLLKISDEFNQRIALHKGPLRGTAVDQSEGQEELVIVNQIFLGLSQGWFVSDDGSYFGYGRAEQDGWTWWSGDSASAKLSTILEADQVLETLRILQNPTEAEYVSMPVIIQN